MTNPDRDLMTEIEQLHAHLRGEHSNERVEGCTACAGLPRISTGGERPVPQNNGSPPTGRKCRCGCGSDVKRRFLPGHDAKLKSRLVKEARNGSEAAREELIEEGWEKFI
jgi:hypothetical protein